MRKSLIVSAGLTAFLAVPATAQVATTTNYNSTPIGGFQYGSGNNYAPANAVHTTTTVQSNDSFAVATDLALRAHITGDQAASAPTGVYVFDLGTSNISFDYSVGGADTSNAMLTLTNLLTGQTAYFNPLLAFGNSTNGFGSVQNSEQLGFGFLNGTGPLAGCCGDLGFSPNVNDTYRIDLKAGALGTTATAFAQVGSGFIPGVPEPATWAMMLVGFGAIGFAMRRNHTAALAVA